jgi:hypothetical protein
MYIEQLVPVCAWCLFVLPTACFVFQSQHDLLLLLPQVVNEPLSPNCRARLTVENDDRAS